MENASDGRKVQALRVGPHSSFFGYAPAEAAYDVCFKLRKVFARHSLVRCNCDRIPAVDPKQSGPHRDVMFRAASVTPAHDRQCKGGQKISMSWQDTEGAGRILGAQMEHIVGIGDDGERGGHGQPHDAASARCSRSRASARSPIM
jgi:hypothetical protein